MTFDIKEVIIVVIITDHTISNVKKLTADDILKTPIDRPDRLFKSSTFIKDIAIAILKWHPDRCKDTKATEVFQHLQSLKKSGNRQLTNGKWQSAHFINFKQSDTTYKFNYKKTRVFELGDMYISDNYVLYVVDVKYKHLFTNAVKQINNIKYANDKLKTEFEKYMPVIKSYNADIGLVLMVTKTPDQVLVADLLDYLPGNKLEPKHVAWLTSSLLNIACFFSVNGICHNAILTSTIFVSTKHHSAAILGGWWYTTADDSKLLALPAEVISLLPSKLLVDKKSKLDYNNRMIRAVGIECLGDSTRTGSKLLMSDIPKTLLSWYESVPSENSIEDYKEWNKTLDLTWGKRTFVELNINVNDVY